MDALRLFLDALEEQLEGEHRGKFVIKRNEKLGIYKAYKIYTEEVWLIDGAYKHMITSNIICGRSVTNNEKEKLLEGLHKDSIKEVLKYYGI